MKYLKKFETEADKNAWLAGSEFVTPNVVLTGEVVEYNIVDPLTIPLYIEAIENLTIEFGNTYEYSKDNSTWSSGTSGTSISADAGEKVYFRASGLVVSESNGIGQFTISGACNVSGNIMSLVSNTNFATASSVNKFQFYGLFKRCPIVDASRLLLPALSVGKSSYREMFYNCSQLISAPELPATQLNTYCYASMFMYCFKLISAPALPATNLKERCYSSMFASCTKLENAPTLSALSLARYSYASMFSGCSALALIKMLATDISASGCLSDWVSNVSATGTFVKNAAATWNVTGASGIPSGWTVELADA